MANSILVTFSTIYGSTQEVADRIAATLREQGLEVDLQPIQQVRTIDTKQLFWVRRFTWLSWHKDALNFLSNHRTALA